MGSDRRSAAVARAARARELAKLPTLDFADPGRELLLDLAADVEALVNEAQPQDLGAVFAAAVHGHNIDGLRADAAALLDVDGWRAFAAGLREGRITAQDALGLILEAQDAGLGEPAPAVFVALGLAAAAEARR